MFQATKDPKKPNTNSFYKNNQQKITLIFFYIFIIGLVLINLVSFGIHIEEKFHRSNGFYWLSYISDKFGYEILRSISDEKLKNIYDYTLSPVNYFRQWGIVLDVPFSLIEIIFSLENIEKIYYIKHFISFLIFLLSSFFFYKILIKRFNNNIFSLVGLIIYISTPRIFGDSFLYKDVLFLSFFTISLYYLIKLVDKNSLKNLIKFSLFSSLSINLKIFGLGLLLTYIFLLLLICLKNKELKIFIKNIFKVFILILILTYCFWPFLWEKPFENFIDLFVMLKRDLVKIRILFNDEYIFNKYLPSFYLPLWILISTPFLMILPSLIGFFFYSTRIIKRFFNIKEESYFFDLWRSKKENIDFIFLFIFINFFLFLIILNAPLYNGWRLVYFLNIFIVYFIIYLADIIYKKLKNKIKKILVFLYCGLFIIALNNAINILIYHPYQSLYFNYFLSDKLKNSFEGDYHGISAKFFFLKIHSFEPNQKLNIAVACHTPLQRGLEALDKSIRSNFNVVGQNYDLANYIYKNNISEVDSKLNKKYNIPKNFFKIYEEKRSNLVIYEIYKKIKL